MRSQDATRRAWWWTALRRPTISASPTPCPRARVLTDARLKLIKLGNLTIEFQRVSPDRLYWADRPAMRVVQALHWLRDTLTTDKERIFKRLLAILSDPDHGTAITKDLHSGLSALPEWLQQILRDLLARASDHHDRVHAPKGKL